MSGKSKESDRTNLGTGAAPINCQYNPVKFLEQPFYKNYPTLDARDTRPLTRQGGFQNRHKDYSVAYGSTKIVSFLFQNNRVFFASAFLSVQFKSNREYSLYSVFQSIQYIPYLTIFHVFRHSAEQGHPNIGEDIITKDRIPVGFLNR